MEEEMKKTIKFALLQAMERGENLNGAVISLINAGFDKKEVIDVANEVIRMQKKEVVDNTKQSEGKKDLDKNVESKITLPMQRGVYKKIEESTHIKLKKETNKEKPPNYEYNRQFYISKNKSRGSAKGIFLFSLLFIIYYVFILIIKYKNWISLMWILFGLPLLLTNLILLIKPEIKKGLNKFVILVNLFSFIGLLIFNLVRHRSDFFNLFIASMFSPKYYFILSTFILSYLLNVFGMIKLKKNE